MEKKLQGLDWEANVFSGHCFREKRNPGWENPNSSGKLFNYFNLCKSEEYRTMDLDVE